MKFIINTTNLQSGGALQVAMSLLEEWNISHPQHHFFVFLSPQLASLIEQHKFQNNFKFYNFNHNPTSSIWTIINFHKQLHKLEQQIKPDAVLSVFGPAIWKPKNPHLVGFANGYYLFDESMFIQERILTNLLKRLQYYLRRNLLLGQLKKEANEIWVEAPFAKTKLAKTIGFDENKISIVGNTYNKQFEIDHPTKKANNKFTFLFVSAYYEHKNFEIIPAVIKILKSRNIECQFKFTLAADRFNLIFNEEYCKDYVVNYGPVNPANSYKLYQQSDAVFMPSLLETFSANYPEAMKMQKPIITSDLAFAKNICGAAALYFDPKNAVDIADKISELIQNKELQKELLNQGQLVLQTIETPAGRATKLISLLEKMATKNN